MGLLSVDARVGSPNVRVSLAPTCATPKTQGTKVCETHKDESVITMVSERLNPQGEPETWQRKARQSLSNAPSCRSHTRGVLCCTFLYQSPTGQERRGISFGCLTSACCLPVCVGLACTLGLARRLRVTGGKKMMRKVAPLKDLPAVLTCHRL